MCRAWHIIAVNLKALEVTAFNKPTAGLAPPPPQLISFALNAPTAADHLNEVLLIRISCCVL